MEDRYLKQFKKGILEVVVLKVILKQEMYGYQIVTELNQKSNCFQIKEGTLYPILYRLEDEGLIESRWEHTELRGKPKKYYCITSSGQETLVRATEQWKEFCHDVNDILNN